MATPIEYVLAFFKEMVLRLKAKNPVFFNVLSWISGLAFVVTGLPALIELIPFIKLPEWLTSLENEIVGTATGIMWFMANIGVNRPVFKHDSGSTVSLIDGDRTNLPFTDKVEDKKPAVVLSKEETPVE
jgi:hypothetical protein